VNRDETPITYSSMFIDRRLRKYRK